MSEQPKPTKRPKRSQSEMAVIHAQRADSARRKSIEATAQYRAFADAQDALGRIQTEALSPDHVQKLNDVENIIRRAMSNLLMGATSPDPKQGVSGTVP